jgi:sirohydrochlorin ferrochelatase
MPTGIIIVDHGSRREASNQMLEQIAELFAQRFTEKYDIVEPAHMELAEPLIATAYARCVQRGATRVIVCPFFLGPGKHWTSDIPRLTADAAAPFPHTRFHVAQTLGIDDLILDLLDKRASHCVDHGLSCDVCRGTLRSGEAGVAIEAAAPAAHAHAPEPKTNAVLCGTCPFRDTQPAAH